MNTYTKEGTAYDISLLDEEAQGLFGLLKDAMVKAQVSNNDVQLYQAAAQHIKMLFEDKLTDEAITENTEDTEVAIEG
jgi:hypothetical protein